MKHFVHTKQEERETLVEAFADPRCALSTTSDAYRDPPRAGKPKETAHPLVELPSPQDTSLVCFLNLHLCVCMLSVYLK